MSSVCCELELEASRLALALELASSEVQLVEPRTRLPDWVAQLRAQLGR